MNSKILAPLIVVTLTCYFFLVAESAGQSIAPTYLTPTDSVFPRSEPPAEQIVVFDARRLPRESQAMVASIQGLVNRKTPELYLLLSRNRIAPLVASVEETTANDAAGNGAIAGSRRRLGIDQVWLDWLKENDYLKSTTTIATTDELLQRYQIHDVVVVDPELPASLNIATMVASVRGIPLAFPEDVERYQLNPVVDLRGRWQTNIEAYQWAFDELWPQMNHRAIAILSTRIHGHLRDYLVEQKIFTFWISKGDYKDAATTTNDLATFKRMLKQMPVNIPVLGYPNSGGRDTGIGEGLGVKLLSDHGKFLVPTDWHTNLSVWTGWKSQQKEFRQPAADKLTFDPDQRYVAIVVSDGDNMNLWLDFMPTQKYWRSQLRGKIPLGWTMGTAMTELHASLLDYYYPSMTSADSFGCALSGMGYMYPQHFGEAYGEHQPKILRRHFEMTQSYTTDLNMRWFWGTIVGPKGKNEFQTIARALAPMPCILEGYGRQWWRDKPYLVDQTAVFHFLNDAVDVEPTRKQVLENFQKRQPQFSVIFIQNWPFDLDAIQSLQESLESENDNIQWVLPEQLADLYRQSLDAQSP